MIVKTCEYMGKHFGVISFAIFEVVFEVSAVIALYLLIDTSFWFIPLLILFSELFIITYFMWSCYR